MEHFLHPDHMGVMASPCGDGTAGAPPGQPFMRIQIRVADERITEARFMTFGCVSAVAAGNFLTTRAVGMPLGDALRLEPRWLLVSLGGLPRDKEFCAGLAVDALRAAVHHARKGDRA